MSLRLPRTLAVLVMIGLLGAVFAVPAAARSDNATVVYRLAMSGAQEVCPAAPTLCGGDGTGEAILIVNPNTDTVCFVARWRDVAGDIFAAHIHEAPAGVAGGIVVPLLGPVSLASEDMARGCVPVDGEILDEINANPSGFYINFHSTVHPMGALRDQLG